MELLAELTPRRTLEKTVGAARELSRYADAIDVPDAPLGLPAPSSPIISALIRNLLSPPPEVVAHVRLLDLSELGAVNVAQALEVAGVSRLVLLRGDRPALGDPCDKEPERVLASVRSIGLRIRLGLLLSLSKPFSEVMRRLSAGADFYFVTRPWRSGLLRTVSSEARRRGARTYVYLVVETPRNAHLLPSIPPEEKLSEGSVREAVSSLEEAVDGVIISSPGDREVLLRSLREAREAIG
ncbi:MAG: hypothetical protein ACP5HK_06415 [Acidilobus sp.]